MIIQRKWSDAVGRLVTNNSLLNKILPTVDETRVVRFLGVRTDRHGFGILTWKHVGTQKISTQSSKLVVSRRSLYASPEDGDA